MGEIDERKNEHLSIKCQQIVGQRIKETRMLFGMSQRELAKKINVGDGTVSSWELGARKLYPYIIDKIAKALNMTSSELLDGIDLETEPGSPMAAKVSADHMGKKRAGRHKKATQEEIDKQLGEKPKKKKKPSHFRSLDACLRAMERYNETHKPHLTYGKFMAKWEAGEITEEDL